VGTVAGLGVEGVVVDRVLDWVSRLRCGHARGSGRGEPLTGRSRGSPQAASGISAGQSDSGSPFRGLLRSHGEHDRGWTACAPWPLGRVGPTTLYPPLLDGAFVQVMRQIGVSVPRRSNSSTPPIPEGQGAISIISIISNYNPYRDIFIYIWGSST